MTNSPSTRRRPSVHITLQRAARLHRLVWFLAETPRTRDTILAHLSIGLRTFYRELELLKRCGVKVRHRNKQYTLMATAKQAEGRLPFPDPQLSFAEMAELAACPCDAGRHWRICWPPSSTSPRRRRNARRRPPEKSRTGRKEVLLDGRSRPIAKMTGEGLEPSTNGLTYLIGFHRPPCSVTSCDHKRPLWRIAYGGFAPKFGGFAMSRKPGVRNKNGYWFSEAGDIGRYFGRVDVVSYSEAMARLWAALAGDGGDRVLGVGVGGCAPACASKRTHEGTSKVGRRSPSLGAELYPHLIIDRSTHSN